MVTNFHKEAIKIIKTIKTTCNLLNYLLLLWSGENVTLSCGFLHWHYHKIVQLHVHVHIMIIITWTLNPILLNCNRCRKFSKEIIGIKFSIALLFEPWSWDQHNKAQSARDHALWSSLRGMLACVSQKHHHHLWGREKHLMCTPHHITIAANTSCLPNKTPKTMLSRPCWRMLWQLWWATKQL